MSGDWAEQAACRGLPVSWFILDHGEQYPPEAKRACASCAVREECRAEARANHEKIGLWGGETPQDRRNPRRRRGSPSLGPGNRAKSELAKGLRVSTAPLKVRWTTMRNKPEVVSMARILGLHETSLRRLLHGHVATCPTELGYRVARLLGELPERLWAS